MKDREKQPCRGFNVERLDCAKLHPVTKKASDQVPGGSLLSDWAVSDRTVEKGGVQSAKPHYEVDETNTFRFASCSPACLVHAGEFVFSFARVLFEHALAQRN